MRKDVIYFASSKSLYEKDIYNKIIKRIQRAYPNSKIIAAKELYNSPKEFYQKWPKILERITILIFASDNNMIGKGTYDEIQDAKEHGIDVYYISPEMDVVPRNKIKAYLINGGTDWVDYVRVRVI
jgi:hypothetical protein